MKETKICMMCGNPSGISVTYCRCGSSTFRDPIYPPDSIGMKMEEAQKIVDTLGITGGKTVKEALQELNRPPKPSEKDRKQKAYSKSLMCAVDVILAIYPNGMTPDQYEDALVIAQRIMIPKKPVWRDKLCQQHQN